jgi:hypothetical protein
MSYVQVTVMLRHLLAGVGAGTEVESLAGSESPKLCIPFMHSL